MKKLMLVLFVLALLLPSAVFAGKPVADSCIAIQSGTLVDSVGQVLTPGYDKWGYNYQAHMFNGWYGNYSRPALPVTGGDKLIMKWNDAWLSNKSCDGDSKLDRHYGFPTYIGSGAWLTNHQSGEYEGTLGETCKWTYFTKIVAVPADATKTGVIWYAADGTEIGPAIWVSLPPSRKSITTRALVSMGFCSKPGRPWARNLVASSASVAPASLWPLPAIPRQGSFPDPVNPARGCHGTGRISQPPFDLRADRQSCSSWAHLHDRVG